jgi:aminoglycoside phosphotransferase family enzyme/predicted kinase
VFLTGEYVYKIKKPVDFGFLDYSTLERRHRCCEWELDLNRRLCPEVYLEVVPIAWDGTCLRVGAGPVVEWAVRMRQLREEELLPAKLASGTVSPSEIEQMARMLAEFHRNAATGPEIDCHGTPEAMLRNIEENFEQTASRTGEDLPADCRSAVRSYARQFLAEYEPLFTARLREGRIRDGHGDLRAQNICLDPSVGAGVQILDRIEFNDRFRCGDVAADLAYLAMDLDLAGRCDLRSALVDRYVIESGDTGLRRLLPFYCCYRAYVRGKIALFAAGEAEIPPDERREHQAVAAAAFDLARSYAEVRDRPLLVAMMGFSGSGKSALARELARRVPAVRIASDEVRKEHAGVPAFTHLGPEEYSAAQRHAVYDELRRRAIPLLEAGLHVLLDATFLAPEERQQAALTAAEHGAEFRVVECRCPNPIIRKHLQARAERVEASDADLAVYEAQVREVTDGPASDPGDNRIIARTDGLIPRVARAVLSELWSAGSYRSRLGEECCFSRPESGHPDHSGRALAGGEEDGNHKRPAGIGPGGNDIHRRGEQSPLVRATLRGGHRPGRRQRR